MMLPEEEKRLQVFFEWLYEQDLLIGYWDPVRNEIMPVLVEGDALVRNYVNGKPAISGKVRRSK